MATQDSLLDRDLVVDDGRRLRGGVSVAHVDPTCADTHQRFATTSVTEPSTTQRPPLAYRLKRNFPTPLANVGSDVRLLAADDEGLWVIHGSGLIELLDSDNLQRRYEYQVGPDSQVLAAQAQDGSLFCPDFASQTVIRLDAGRLESAFAASVPRLQSGMTLVDDTVWVAWLVP